MTHYTGICRDKPTEDGTTILIRVRTTPGNGESFLKVEDYERRNILPPWNTLPICGSGED